MPAEEAAGTMKIRKIWCHPEGLAAAATAATTGQTRQAERPTQAAEAAVSEAAAQWAAAALA